MGETFFPVFPIPTQPNIFVEKPNKMPLPGYRKCSVHLFYIGPISHDLTILWSSLVTITYGQRANQQHRNGVSLVCP